jgi:hypothetical protein
VTADKKCDVEWHFMTMHKGDVSKYPDNSEMWRNKVEDLKQHMIAWCKWQLCWSLLYCTLYFICFIWLQFTHAISFMFPQHLNVFTFQHEFWIMGITIGICPMDCKSLHLSKTHCPYIILNISAKWLLCHFMYSRSQVQISVQRPAILTEVFMVFLSPSKQMPR